MGETQSSLALAYWKKAKETESQRYSGWQRHLHLIGPLSTDTSRHSSAPKGEWRGFAADQEQVPSLAPRCCRPVSSLPSPLSPTSIATFVALHGSKLLCLRVLLWTANQHVARLPTVVPRSLKHRSILVIVSLFFCAARDSGRISSCRCCGEAGCDAASHIANTSIAKPNTGVWNRPQKRILASPSRLGESTRWLGSRQTSHLTQNLPTQSLKKPGAGLLHLSNNQVPKKETGGRQGAVKARRDAG